jgi:hypothetical protein
MLPGGGGTRPGVGITTTVPLSSMPGIAGSGGIQA